MNAELVASDSSRRQMGLIADIFDPPQAELDVDWTGDGTCTNDNGLTWAYAWLEMPD